MNDETRPHFRTNLTIKITVFHNKSSNKPFRKDDLITYTETK